MENLDKICVSYVKPIYTVSSNQNLVHSINRLNHVSLKMDIPFSQVIASTEFAPEKSRVMFTGHEDWVHIFFKHLESEGFQLSLNVQHGLFISGFGISSSNYEQKVFEHLGLKNIHVSKYIRDAKGLLLVFPESHQDTFVQFSKFLID